MYLKHPDQFLFFIAPNPCLQVWGPLISHLRQGLDQLFSRVSFLIEFLNLWFYDSWQMVLWEIKTNRTGENGLQSHFAGGWELASEFVVAKKASMWNIVNSQKSRGVKGGLDLNYEWWKMGNFLLMLFGKKLKKYLFIGVPSGLFFLKSWEL